MARVIREKQLFKADLFNVRRVDVRHDNGRKFSYDIVEKGDSAMIVPIDKNGDLILIREFFPAINSYQLGLPKGKVESVSPLKAANKELQEEIGYKAGKLVHLATLGVSPGNVRHKTHIYLGMDLKESKMEGDEDEDIELARIPFRDFERLIARKKLTEARVIAALYLAKNYVKKHHIVYSK